jgi:hypothetical protein
MRVEFYKPSEKHALCAWQAVRGKRTVVPGTVMAGGASVPHDLAQYVIEAATGYANGFWGLLARGATYKSTGRKVTKPGRALIVAHRAELAASEALAGEHLQRWRAGSVTPVTQALDRALEQWRALAPAERLVFEWPSPHGVVVVSRPPAASGRSRT